MRRILVNDKNEFKCSREGGGSRALAVRQLGEFYKSVDKTKDKSTRADSVVVTNKAPKGNR